MAREIEKAADRLSIAPMRVADGRADNRKELIDTLEEVKEALPKDVREYLTYTERAEHDDMTSADIDVDEIAAVIAERLKQAAFNM